MANPIQFIKEAKNELQKVIWPTRRETINITLGVIGISLFVAAILGAADFGLTKLIEYAITKQ
ncbi:MAG: preprotein translocase subunit SecE [Candidatus Doudnabacteria bacterium]|nr:preprotein translocase subunit SecE [Candidatus Doudnabacteria bacterium]